MRSIVFPSLGPFGALNQVNRSIGRHLGGMDRSFEPTLTRWGILSIREGAGPKARSSPSDRGRSGLAAGGGDGVRNRGELALGVATQQGQGGDADDGDEGEQEGVLHQGGAFLVAPEASP